MTGYTVAVWSCQMGRCGSRVAGAARMEWISSAARVQCRRQLGSDWQPAAGAEQWQSGAQRQTQSEVLMMESHDSLDVWQPIVAPGACRQR